MIAQMLAGQVRALAYGNPLYGLTLRGKAPTALSTVPFDPWPGDAERGQAMMRGICRFAGESHQYDRPNWQPAGAGPAFLAALHGFDWLRHLRAVGGDEPRRHARRMVASWLDTYPAWDRMAWAPEVLGRRLSSWLSFHDFFCASADDEFRARLFDSLMRQTRHLARCLPGGLKGVDLLVAAKGLALSGLAIPGGAARLDQALTLFERELPRQVLPDGCHVSRSPAACLQVLRLLVDLRAALRNAHEEVPDAIQHAVDRLAPAVRFFRHGDGGLALFNGSREGKPLLIDAVLAQADAGGRPLASAPHGGFARVQNGRALLLFECGRPAEGPLVHAGTLSFEFSVGRERLIVNCGSHPAQGPWRQSLRATAAHSTVTLADTNSTALKAGGGAGRRPQSVTAERKDGEAGTLLEASHDGWKRVLGVLHRRRLYLSAEGDDLRGEDILEGPSGRAFVLRFHLHPDVNVSLTGHGALLRLPSGQFWRLRASGGEMRLEDSLYLGRDTTPRRASQIVLAGRTADGATPLKWALQRETGAA